MKNLYDFLICRNITEKFSIINNFHKIYLADKSFLEKELFAFSPNTITNNDLSKLDILSKEKYNDKFSDNESINGYDKHDLDTIHYPENTIILPEKEIKINVITNLK